MLRRMTAEALLELLLDGEYDVTDGYTEQDVRILLQTGVMASDHPFDVEFSHDDDAGKVSR